MPFNIYRQDGYSGQDLHILRNGSPFIVSDFILVGASDTVVYTFRLPGSATTFENIVVTSSGSGSSTIASITASAISAPTLNNFYVNVVVTSGGEQSSTSILIRLHDAITALRLSPTPLTIRPSLSGVKFCVLATFTGGIMGEISWYPNLTWDFESNVPNYIVFDTSTVPFTNQTTNRLIYVPPTTAPSAADFADCIKLTLPLIMQATGSISVAYGSISFKTDNPVIALLTGGNFGETDTRMNILMLSDGFGGGTSSNADFSTAATEMKNEFGMPISKPWNLFERNINYWSFYLEGREGGGILTEPQIKITTGSTDIKTVSINQFCKTFRAVIIYLQGGTERLFLAQTHLKGVYDSDLVDFYDLSFFVASPPFSATKSRKFTPAAYNYGSYFTS